MNGEKELKKKEIQRALSTAQMMFDRSLSQGYKDWNLLQEINELKEQLNNDVCDIDGECLSCGS
jgi:hypothetical protein